MNPDASGKRFGRLRKALWTSLVGCWIVMQIVLVALYTIFFVQWQGFVGLVLALALPPMFVVFPIVYLLLDGQAAGMVFLMWVPLWVGGAVFLLRESKD